MNAGIQYSIDDDIDPKGKSLLDHDKVNQNSTHKKSRVYQGIFFPVHEYPDYKANLQSCQRI